MKKETKNYKKWLALGSAVVLGFTSVPMGLIPVYAKESVTETVTGLSEDQIKNATPLTFNEDWLSDSIDREERYYSVDLPKDGNLIIQYNGDTLEYADILLYGNEMQYQTKIEDAYNDGSRTWTYHLNAGRYYIRVKVGDYLQGRYSGSYSIKTKFEDVQNTDAPYHNSFEKASTLSLNQEEIGFLSMYSSDKDCDDYYKFTVPETGKYTIRLASNDSAELYTKLYDSEQNEMKNCYDDSRSEQLLKVNTPTAQSKDVIVEKGKTYFLRINSYDTGKYTLRVKRADTLAEDITVTPAQKTVTVGQSIKLSTIILPDTTTNQNVYWKSDNQTCATVKNGKVTTKRPGIATITAETLDGSEKTACATIMIRPKQTATPKLKAGKRTLNASWKEQAGVTGYQVQYSQDKTFKKKGSKPATTSKIALNDLKKGTYYVRVRAYVTDEYQLLGKTATMKKNVYGAWSNAKSVKVK